MQPVCQKLWTCAWLFFISSAWPRAPWKSLHLDTVAKMIAAWRADLEEQVGGGSRDALQPSSICLKVSKGILPEFNGLGAQHGSHMLSHFIGRRSLYRISLECPMTKNWCPSNDTSIPDQSVRRHGPLVPILPKRPSGSCHHKRPKWASSGETIWPSSLRRTKRRPCMHTRQKEQKGKKQAQEQVKRAHA